MTNAEESLYFSTFYAFAERTGNAFMASREAQLAVIEFRRFSQSAPSLTRRLLAVFRGGKT